MAFEGPVLTPMISRTTKEIAEWIACNYEDGGANVCNAIDAAKLVFDPFPVIPDPAPAATAVELKRWEFELKQRFHEELNAIQHRRRARSNCQKSPMELIEETNSYHLGILKSDEEASASCGLISMVARALRSASCLV